jgi:hypothetical protein
MVKARVPSRLPIPMPVLVKLPHRPTSVLRGVLDAEQRRPAPFAARGEALHQAQQHQRDRGQHADCRVTRQAADREGAAAHQQQGEHQHRLAADPVTEMAEHDAAQRPGDEAGAERGEGHQCADHVVEAREEHRREDQRRGQAVDDEVVELEGGAESGDEEGAAGGCRLPLRAWLTRADPAIRTASSTVSASSRMRRAIACTGTPPASSSDSWDRMLKCTPRP